MVGLSSRFFAAGYELPKYQLLLGGKSVFYHAINSFREYFEKDLFIFPCRNDYGTVDFIKNELTGIGLKNYKIIPFSQNTRGQAETVYIGIRNEDPNDDLYIFNIDTFLTNFSKANRGSDCDAYLEVFKGQGEHWSFALPGENESVIKTTEKERISDLCSNGLYYFRKKSLFDLAFEIAIQKELTTKGEFYVAPLYNILISNGKSVKYKLIEKDNIVFCGTPIEYEQLLDKID